MALRKLSNKEKLIVVGIIVATTIVVLPLTAALLYICQFYTKQLQIYTLSIMIPVILLTVFKLW